MPEANEGGDCRTGNSHYGRPIAAGGDGAPPSIRGNHVFRRVLEGVAPSTPEFGGQDENCCYRTGSSRRERLLIALFFLSGVSGLIYEIVWVRMLTVFVGGGAFAVSIVVAVFMAGLALGSAISGRLADRIQGSDGLVALYGALETAIGLCGLLFPLVIRRIEFLYAALYGLLCETPLTYNLAAGLLSAGLLLVPTTLMGATLPPLCRYYAGIRERVGGRIGFLYGINTLGGAVGALLTGFFLIRYFGLYGTIGLAVLLNLAIGLACLSISGGISAVRSALAAMRSAAFPRIDARGRLVALPLLLAVSGFCSMACQVVWTKLLALTVGPTTYSFTLVLFTFITGLALGAALLGRLADRTRDPWGLLLLTQALAALLVLASSQLLADSQMYFAKLIYTFRDRFALGEFFKAASLLLFMLPPTLLLGGAFPIAMKILVRDTGETARSVGRLYAANTVGAVLGSLCAGFILIPAFGKSLSVSLLVAVQAGVALIFAALVYRGAKWRRVAVGLACMLVAAACARFPRWDQTVYMKGKYQRISHVGAALDNVSYWSALARGGALREELFPSFDEALFIEDDAEGLVSVSRSIDSIGVTNVFLSINGKTDASSVGDMNTQTMSAHIPMLLHSGAKRVMVLGLASGVTAGEVLHYPVESMDVLELSRGVIRACRRFDEWNNGVLHDRRVRLLQQDARTHLALTGEKYDVITCEPSNPWIAGMANVFTKEFFASGRSHLNPEGIFVQWLHSYQMDRESFAMIGRTFAAVFSNSFFIRTSEQGQDFLLVGFKDEAARIDIGKAEENVVYARKSKNVRIESALVLLPLLVTENVRELFPAGLLHSDVYPYLEYAAPRNMHRSESFPEMREKKALTAATTVALTALSDVGNQLFFARYLCSVADAPYGWVDIGRASEEQKSEYRGVLDACYRTCMLSDYGIIQDAEEKGRCMAIQENLIRGRIAEILAVGDMRDIAQRRLSQAYRDLGRIYVARGDLDTAGSFFDSALKAWPGHFDARLDLAACFERGGEFERAIAVLLPMAGSIRRTPELLARLGGSYLKLGRVDEAKSFFERAIGMNPAFAPALVALGAMYGNAGEYDRAIEYSMRAMRADPRAIEAYRNLALAYGRQNRIEEAREYVQAGLLVAPTNDVLLLLAKALGISPESGGLSAGNGSQ